MLRVNGEAFKLQTREGIELDMSLAYGAGWFMESKP